MNAERLDTIRAEVADDPKDWVPIFLKTAADVTEADPEPEIEETS